MSLLADVQHSFSRALVDPEKTAPAVLVADGGGRPRGFDVYRNNRMSALVDALAATYPAVQRLVGDEFFCAAARAYVERDPPRSPILQRYGGRFGDFLDGFPPAGGIPYLGDVARLEWSCLRAYHAADAEPIAIQALTSVPAQATPMLKLELHPSLALHRFRWPVGSLWSALRGPGDGSEVDMTRAEDVLVVRPALEVEARILPDGAHAFVSALAEGAAIEQAARRGATDGNRFDLATELQGLFALGAVVAVRPCTEDVS